MSKETNYPSIFHPKDKLYPSYTGNVDPTNMLLLWASNQTLNLDLP